LELTLTLTKEEIAGIIQVLGNLPTSSGAFPLMMKIDAQVKQQEETQND